MLSALRAFLNKYWFVLLTVFVGLIVTVWLAYAQHRATNIQLAEKFRVAAGDRINVIRQAIQNTITVGHSVVSFFQSSDNVNRGEFATFTSNIIKEYPYIEALEWAQRVESRERKLYEKFAQEAVPGFSFRDISDANQLIPATERDIYYPILYIEPIADYTKRVLGVDFMTHPVRKIAMEDAMVSNKTAVTSRVTLLSSEQPGVLFFSPVTKAAVLEGFVVSAVPLQTLVNEAITPLNKEGVNIIAYDVTDAGKKPELLFIHASRLKKASDEEVMGIYNSSAMRVEEKIDVAGRQWRITVVPSQGFFAVSYQDMIVIILTGFLFTAMLAYYMANRIQENVRIKGIVTLRTAELEQIARYDHLTELANRRLFLELLEQALARSERAKNKVGILYIDLNDFKPVNDRLGHAAGDALLKAFGDRINKELRNHDTMARLGGDEFAILADNIQGAADCEVLLARLLAVINNPYTIMGNEVKVGASIGVAIYPDNAQTLDDFIAAADSAMYAAKKDKTKPYVFYAEG